MPKTSNYIIKEPLWLSLMVVIGIVVGLKLSPSQDGSFFVDLGDKQNNSIGKVDEVIQFIESRYVDDVDEDELITSAVTSIFSELDPHSSYLPPNQLKDVEEDMKGVYEGIGVQTILRDDTIFIQHVLQNSPALKAGLLVGDRIILIDSTKMSGTGLPYTQLRKGLDFKAAETRKMIVQRRGHNMEINITAEAIPTPAVELAYEIEADVVFIKLKRFSENVYKEFMEALEELVVPDKPFDLILDLRDNPGGYLPETIKILNQIFEEKNKLLVYTEDRNNRKTEYKTNGTRFFEVQKVVVLINEASASASEIIAAAIQDWDRGIVIGQTSFGKGLVQEQYNLKNGGAIRLTVSRYFTPSGRIIQKPYENEMAMETGDTSQFYTKKYKRKISGSGGVSPDLTIESSDRDNDTCILASEDVSYFIAKQNIVDESMVSTSAFVNQYLRFLKETYEIDSPNVCTDAIQKAYQNTLIKNKAGLAEMLKVKNQKDTAVKAALSQLKKDDLFNF